MLRQRSICIEKENGVDILEMIRVSTPFLLLRDKAARAFRSRLVRFLVFLVSQPRNRIRLPVCARRKPDLFLELDIEVVGI